MTDAEHKQAALALLDWFESQDISVSESMLVMATAMAGIVHEVARHNGTDPRAGANIVARMIKRTVAEND